MIWVEDRAVYVKTGSRTQTVNICSPENRRGVYETKLRMAPPVQDLQRKLEEKSFSRISDLVSFVKNDLRGNMEVTSEGSDSKVRTPDHRRKILLKQPVNNRLCWEDCALAILEQSIDRLVLDFVRNPYLHRVEHSLHAEFYRILSQHRILSESYSGRGFHTQTIHKEWPEFRPRPEKGNRRGNFDISLLSPDCIARASRSDFRGGHIEPFAAVEVGLDYPFKHLTDDVRKLVNSGIENAYVVHLVREDVQDDFQGIEDFLAETNTKAAYARIVDGYARCKLVGEEAPEQVALS